MKQPYFFRAFYVAMLLFAVTGYAQNDAKVKSIAESACDCAKEISSELPKEKIIEEINTCISSKTLLSQLSAINLNSKEEKTAIDSTAVKKEYTITLGEDKEAIQAYMFDNCEVVKFLMASNNARSKQSMSKNKKAMEYYNEGQEYAANEKYDMAVVSYNRAVKADPKFAFAWDNLGINYRMLGNYKEAIKCYEKSLAIDPNGIMPLQNIAIAYEYLKDYKNAAAQYEKVVKLRPQDPEGYYGAGRALYLCDNYEKGLDYMFKAYLMYTEAESPYVNDAKTLLSTYYDDLKKKNKLDIFTQAAKNNKIDLK